MIQELWFPTSCGRVKFSADGESMIATGCYPPQSRVYELRELSLKFSHHFVADIVQFQILSADWKKLAYLLSDRTIELHSQFGKHHTVRVPHHGRDLAYQPETCELLVGGDGPECFRLNLERGCFMAPLATGASGINTVSVAPTHGMLALGTADGAVQCWDPRQRSLLGAVSPHESLGPEAAGSAPPEVTAMRFAPGGLQLSVGTASGHVAIYDIRRGAPLLVKDHQYGLPIKDIKYHRGHVVSADAKIIKLWEAGSGKVFTNIQPAADINDVAVCADSGMLFAGLETERLGAYFIPALGPAPRWCHFLDSLTEEMEEQAATDGMYDDYKFVTREQLEQLRLTSLLGTNTLRPYMHGFFIDARLHAKAVSLSQPFAYEQWRKERVAAKIDAKTAGRIAPVTKQKVRVNAELADELQKKAGKLKKKADKAKRAGLSAEEPMLDELEEVEAGQGAGGLLNDARFAQLFDNADFQIDTSAEEYLARHTHLRDGNKAVAKSARAQKYAGEPEP